MRQILEDLTGLKLAKIADGDDVFGFDIGQPVGEVLPAARERLKQVGSNSHAYGYQYGYGLHSLREQFCKRLAGKYNLACPVTPERVLVSRGSKPVFPSLARIMLRPGDSAIVPSVGYAIHYDSVVKVGGNALTYQCGPGVNVFDEILRVVDSAPYAKYLLINTPHNPTCITVDSRFFPRLVERVKPLGMTIVVDMAYEDLVLSGSQATSIFEAEGTHDMPIIETHSMTKGHNIAGVGLIVGRQDLLCKLMKDMSDDGYGQFLPLQFAAEAALHDEEAVERNRDLYRGIDSLLTDGLNSIGWQAERTKATFYKWIQVPDGFTAEQLCFGLLEHANVSIWPEGGFTNGQPVRKPGERERVRFSMVETHERTSRAIEAMERFFKERPDLKQ
jgi:alanine-synthesizing transaminase